jgi:hypothetical protein
MGVGKHMKTFFAAMTEQVGMGGYGPKIKMTPMGPFKWNDNIQLWENVNNGSTMNNISFQDMNMMDYDTLGGGNRGSALNFNPTLTPADWGNLNTMDTAGTVYWASSTGVQVLVANAANVAFSNLGASISVTLTISKTVGSDLGSIRYSLNGGAPQIYSTALTISNTDTLKVGVTTPGGIASGGGNIIVTNTTTSTVLDQIPYVLNVE